MLIEQLRQRGIDRILHNNFDSLEHEEIMRHLAPNGKAYLFLDVIQEVKSWEKVVNSLMTDFNVDFYVTGSNSRMMSSEISTHLTGRQHWPSPTM